MSTRRPPPLYRWKDGHPWRIGDDQDVAWIREGTVIGLGITSGVPPVFASYATVVLPTPPADQNPCHRQVLSVLREHTPDQPWLLGFLNTGSDDLVFPDAPPVTLYTGWQYVVVEAGADQADHWRRDGQGFARPGADVVFPADRSWLVTHLWDDDWLCVGASAPHVERLVTALAPQARRVLVDDEDATPPGHVAL